MAAIFFSLCLWLPLVAGLPTSSVSLPKATYPLSTAITSAPWLRNNNGVSSPLATASGALSAVLASSSTSAAAAASSTSSNPSSPSGAGFSFNPEVKKWALVIGGLVIFTAIVVGRFLYVRAQYYSLDPPLRAFLLPIGSISIPIPFSSKRFTIHGAPARPLPPPAIQLSTRSNRGTAVTGQGVGSGGEREGERDEDDYAEEGPRGTAEGPDVLPSYEVDKSPPVYATDIIERGDLGTAGVDRGDEEGAGTPDALDHESNTIRAAREAARDAPSSIPGPGAADLAEEPGEGHGRNSEVAVAEPHVTAVRESEAYIDPVPLRGGDQMIS